MISELFVLSGRNDILFWNNYRHDVEQNSRDIFINALKESKKEHLLPYFSVGDIKFYQIQRNGLYFVATSKWEITPIFVIELLSRIYHICKDFLGVVREESFRLNIILLQELLGEVLDHGYVQLATTEKLKPYVQSDPILIAAQRSSGEDAAARLLGIDTRIAPGSAANKPVVRGSSSTQENRKNEVFVDVIERLTVILNSDDTVARMEVNGTVNMRSFLAGSPYIKLAINEDLTVGKKDGATALGGHVQLDQCSYHPCVKLDEFETKRCLIINPPVGEFSVMRYSLTGDLPLGLPFRLMAATEDTVSNRDMDLVLRLRNDIPAHTHAVNVVLSIPVPANVSSITQQLSGPGQSSEFKASERIVAWSIKEFPGSSDLTARFRLISSDGVPPNRSQIGPVALEFELSGYACSGFQIRYLRVVDRGQSYVPQRWIRYITASDSYILKI